MRVSGNNEATITQAAEAALHLIENFIDQADCLEFRKAILALPFELGPEHSSRGSGHGQK